MSTIAEELTSYNNLLKNAYDSAVAKGATIPGNKNMENMANTIASITAGSTIVTGVVLNMSTALNVGSPVNPTLNLTFADGKTLEGYDSSNGVSFTTSDPTVAQVDVDTSGTYPKAVVNPLAGGNVTITATVGTVSASVQATVSTVPEPVNPYKQYSAAIQDGTMERQHHVGDLLFTVPYTEDGTTYEMPMIIAGYTQIEDGDGNTKNACILVPHYASAGTTTWSADGGTGRNYSNNPTAKQFLENTYVNYYPQEFLAALAPTVKIGTNEYNSWDTVTSIANKMWIPSMYEVGLAPPYMGGDRTKEGPELPYFDNNAKRLARAINAQGSAAVNWLSRSLPNNSPDHEYIVSYNGTAEKLPHNNMAHVRPLMALI